MKSAQILAEYWHEPDAYQSAILEEFQWMKRERKVIEKLRNSRHLSVFDAMILKQNSKRMGMQVTFNRAVRLIRHLR